jgi:tetratricopeptide (TPR) repeat protein
LAQTYFELGELDSSIKTYKQLLRFKPNHATAWYNLGIIYRNKGMKKEAVKCIEQAVRIDPKLMK